MRVISIFTVDASKAGPPTPEAICNMTELIKEYSANGVLVDTGGVAPTGTSLRVTGDGRGPIAVTDGPFTESKEVLGGYAVLDVKDRAHLLEVTQRFLACAGGGTCTIHQLAQMDEPACAQ
ncbi:MAG TPA: YciI family protein [Candidatus Acidoferrum sp.]|nr:YciI family protein [Candidatus Acidoferrum sp.]